MVRVDVAAADGIVEGLRDGERHRRRALEGQEGNVVVAVDCD